MPSSSKATSGPPAPGPPSRASTAVAAVLTNGARAIPKGPAHTGERPATHSSRWWRGAPPSRCQTATYQLRTKSSWAVSFTVIPTGWTMWPTDTITSFDAFLEARRLELDAVVVGGAALALLGVVSRRTRDFDILYPPLSVEIAEAARAFAHRVRTEGD